MRRLEYIGQPGPHRDIETFVTNVKKANPALTDAQVEKIVRKANAKFKPRYKLAVWTVFGEDAMGADLTQMQAWPHLDAFWRKNLPLFPVQGGEVIHSSEDGARRLDSLIKTLGPSKINRRSILIPVGLSQTYVWRRENAWTQEVTDADVEILRHTPILNQCFRDRDQATGPLEIRYFQRLPTEQHVFANASELLDFENDRKMTKTWKGV